MAEYSHTPVMVRECLEALAVVPGGTYVDGTTGLGGHTAAIADRAKPGGRILACDWDGDTLAVAQRRLADVPDVQIEFLAAAFSEAPAWLREREWTLDGVLLDLGLSSAQVDDPERGMAFSADGPLDMRMDRRSGETAAAWLNRATPAEIADVLHHLGDERWSVAIARKILERRRERPLSRTTDLVECVLAAIPVGAREPRLHPATRTFQAVRLKVTGELEHIAQALREFAPLLRPHGVIAVLSYHSGEDRIVKHTFRELSREGYCELFRKPQTASSEEIAQNRRARSAKLRALIRS
jgi:16S rRNA (cytosine1402-N4)-methyltransferase